MLYSKIKEDARVQEMILKEASEAAEDCAYAACDAVRTGYEAVEHAVVGGYKRIEETAVRGYTRVEDAFVEKFLCREGETIGEARTRLREEQAIREAGQMSDKNRSRHAHNIDPTIGFGRGAGCDQREHRDRRSPVRAAAVPRIPYKQQMTRFQMPPQNTGNKASGCRRLRDPNTALRIMAAG